MRNEDVQLVANALRRDFTEIIAHEDLADDAPVPVRVIDCVLSLFRPYDTVVHPRVVAFMKARPDVHTCADLLALIGSYPSPVEFLRMELKTNDTQRAATLLGVVQFLNYISANMPGETEPQRLLGWAQQSRPRDYLNVGVRGFGLAGFQYLRMLLGADTIKPDVHIVRYVEGVLNRKVSDLHSLAILEEAARLLGVPARAVDSTIWRAGARGD